MRYLVLKLAAANSFDLVGECHTFLEAVDLMRGEQARARNKDKHFKVVYVQEESGEDLTEKHRLAPQRRG